MENEAKLCLHQNGASIDPALDQTLEELDDEEFELPSVSDVPTLESILNEDDQDSVSDSKLDFLPAPTPLKNAILGDSGDTASVHSKNSESRSKSSSDHNKAHKKDNFQKSHGSILRHVVLKGISTQIIQAAERVDAGLPTTMDVGNLICIGTSHGLVLVFDHSQALKWCLGSTEHRDLYGGVSALTLNQDSSRVLAGYSKGHVCLFDLISGKLLQNLSDVHTPHTAVLHMKWTDCPGLVLLSDSGGSVYEFSIKRLLGRNAHESRCIFSGSRGEVCTIEPLNMGQLLTLPPAVDTVIIAMATISKVLIMSLRPHLKVHFSKSLPSSKSNLPLLAWQFVIIQIANETKVVDPVLAFGRDNTLYFYQLTHSVNDDLTFIFLQEIVVSYTLQSIAWLNSRSLAVIDTAERLHVIDVKSKEELDRVDLAKLGLVYATSHFKGLSTGSNVSKAMAAYGERACYHSMKALGPQVLLLGTKSFQVLTVRPWTDRLNHLVKSGKITEALHVGLDIFQNKAIGVTGLSQNKEKRAKVVQEKILYLLMDYLIKVEEEAPPRESLQKLINYYEQVVPLCVKVSIEAGLHEFLFTNAWDVFSADSIARGVFLESLEPYILDDKISDLSPVISQFFMSHYEEKARVEALEACLVRLSIESLDLHQTMTLCWTHGLYDAMFYVHTQGMLDYVTPLEELVTVLKNALESNQVLTGNQVSLGNKLLVYISSCLAGRAYPRGNIEASQIKQVKHEVFKSITTLHSKDAPPEEMNYPFLRTLLRFDTREFLNVLALAFEEEEFCSELGIVQRHRVIDILLEIMTEDDRFDAAQLGSLYTFIARQISKQKSNIPFSQQLCKQVMENLTSCEAQTRHEERESAILDLLYDNKLNDFDPKSFLEKAEKAKFYRVCEYMYASTGDHAKILHCYTQDPLRKHQSFAYIQTVLSAKQTTDQHKQLLKQQIVQQIKDLLTIDSGALALLLFDLECLWPLIPQIAEELHPHQELSYEYLSSLFLYRSSMAPSSKQTSSQSNGCDDVLCPELQEEFIRLMALQEPDRVYRYLRDITGYRIHQTLAICEEHNLEEATGYLLQQKGDIKTAFQIYLRLLQRKIQQVICSIEKKDKGATSLGLGQISLQVARLVQICEEGSRNAGKETTEGLWLPLLDMVLSLQPKVSLEPDAKAEVRNLIATVVNSMMSFISLPAILERIVGDPGYSNCTYEQVKHLLQDMLQRYTYEKTLYSVVVKIIQKDQLKYLGETKRQTVAPLAATASTCSVCESSTSSTTQMIAFSCGHLYHLSCGNADTCSLCCPQTLVDDVESPGVRETKLTNSQIQGLSKMAVLDDPVARWSCLGRRFSRTNFFDTKGSQSQCISRSIPVSISQEF